MMLRRIHEHRVLAHRNGPAGDGKNIYVLGARRIAKQRVSRGHDNDVRLDHGWLTLLTRAGEYALGGVRARERELTTPADVDRALLCELIAMNNNGYGYPAVWSAKLIAVPHMQVAAIEPVNVVMRVVYNTLDGIINDYFVITASVAKR